MHKKLFFIFWFLSASLMMGCSTVKTNNNLSYVPNSILGSLNPAPADLAPQDVTGKNLTSSPIYKQTEADSHYALGEAYSLNGNSNRAIEEFKLATVYDPTSATIRLRLAGEYLQKGLLTEAVEQAQKAEKLAPNDNNVHIFLGGVYQALQMYPQSEAEYKSILARDPKQVDALIYLGAVMAEQERYASAAGYFKKAAATHSDKSALAYYYLGKMRASQGKRYYKKAEYAFGKSLELNPRSSDSALALSDLYAAEGQEKKGIKLLESFEQQYGPNQDVASQLSQIFLDDKNYSEALKNLEVLEGFDESDLNVKVKIALILIEEQNYNGAIYKLQQILAAAPNSNKIRFYLGAVYEQTKQYQLAADSYEKIQSSSEYYADAIVHAAYLLQKLNQDGAAKKLLKVALTKRDNVPQFYAFYASLLDNEHQYQKGITLLNSAVKKFPANTQLRYYLGAMYDDVGQRQKTVAEMKKILSIDADHVQALNYLAYTYAEEGKHLSSAEKLAQKAMLLQPNDPYILDTMGWVLFKQGRVGDAIQYLEAAYKLNNHESVIAEHLGDAYDVFELTDKAKQMYERAAAIEHDPAKESEIRAKLLSLGATSGKGQVLAHPASVDQKVLARKPASL